MENAFVKLMSMAAMGYNPFLLDLDDGSKE
jgi:hypothetical protein